MKKLARVGVGAVIGAVLWSASGTRAQDIITAQEASPSTYPQQSGAALYRAICQGCHMPDGKGATGAGTYPALASNPRLAAAAYPLVIVLKGRRAMPPFGEDLNDEQIAAVVNFARISFGNTYSDVATVADVQALRRAVSLP